MSGEHADTLIDHYKGMEIRVRARRLGQHAWRCRIRIRQQDGLALDSVGATVRSTEAGVTQQSALLGAFMEAMALCDLLLEKSRPQPR